MSYIALIKKLVPCKKRNLRAAGADWRRPQWGLGISHSTLRLQSMGRRGRPPAPWLARGSPTPDWHRGALWWGRSCGVAMPSGTASCAGEAGGLFWEQNQHGTRCLIQPHWMAFWGEQVLGAPQSTRNFGLCHFSLLTRGDLRSGAAKFTVPMAASSSSLPSRGCRVIARY